MEDIKLTTNDGKEIKFKLAAGKFQAVCTGGGLPICGHIGSWFGPERDSRSQAEGDRDAHKNQCSHHNPEVVQW
jgi:hypothetical protein